MNPPAPLSRNVVELLMRKHSPGRRTVFGRRHAPPTETNARKDRLEALRTEFNLLLFGGEQEAAASQLSAVMTGGEPVLVVGGGAGKLEIEINSKSDSFILKRAGEATSTLIFGSDRQVIDCMIDHLANAVGLSPATMRDPIDELIGRSLEEINRNLVLRTLVHFRGDRRLAAASLRIDETTLCALIRRYILAAEHASEERS